MTDPLTEYRTGRRGPAAPRYSAVDGATVPEACACGVDGVIAERDALEETADQLRATVDRNAYALAAAHNDLAAVEARVRAQIAADLLAEARPHDARGFSAIGDAYAHAARIARGDA